MQDSGKCFILIPADKCLVFESDPPARVIICKSYLFTLRMQDSGKCFILIPADKCLVFELEMILGKWENQKHESTSTSNSDFADEFGISSCATAKKTCCS
jgi:hypothetical protein